MTFWLTGAATLLVLATTLTACGQGPMLLGQSGLSRAAMVAPPVDHPAPAEPAGPAVAADYLPLVYGATWQFTNVGPSGTGETRNESITQLFERPNPTGPGTNTIAEIQRLETGRTPITFTIERFPGGLIRSYDPTLPRIGAPIQGARSDKPQEWGYNPVNWKTGYFRIFQIPGSKAETVGGKTYPDCIKVEQSTDGPGFPVFQRETTWAAGIGPVRVIEVIPNRAQRVFRTDQDRPDVTTATNDTGPVSADDPRITAGTGPDSWRSLGPESH